MVTINPDSAYVTVVNVFTVAPDKADELLAIAVATTQSTISKMPGFVWLPPVCIGWLLLWRQVLRPDLTRILYLFRLNHPLLFLFLWQLS